eukprot:364487-Chlamydomonas_euryale.AAC.7
MGAMQRMQRDVALLKHDAEEDLDKGQPHLGCAPLHGNAHCMTELVAGTDDVPLDSKANAAITAATAAVPLSTQAGAGNSACDGMGCASGHVRAAVRYRLERQLYALALLQLTQHMQRRLAVGKDAAW